MVSTGNGSSIRGEYVGHILRKEEGENNHSLVVRMCSVPDPALTSRRSQVTPRSQPQFVHFISSAARYQVVQIVNVLMNGQTLNI